MLPYADINLRNTLSNILRPLLNPSTSYEMLSEDPTSLNLLTPTSPGNFIKNQLRSSLINMKWIKNPLMLEMIDAINMLVINGFNWNPSARPSQPRQSSRRQDLHLK